MKKEDLIEINRLFETIIETVGFMLKNDLYTEKGVLLKIKESIEKWYEDFKTNDSLVSINVDDLKFLDLEVTELLSKYIKIEPVSKNHSEVLSYYFGIVKKYWKDEMRKE